jgi:ubiquinone/menaquinone biosynthesis C-methylase UbiE
VTRRYDRMAWLYDIYDAPMEWMGTRARRRRVVAGASGRVLEAGVGTGKNLAHYPSGVDVTGIDVSEAMLSRARAKAVGLEIPVTLEQADVTELPFPDDSFDTAVATCVFCSVAEPVAGLSELGRVTKPGGRVLLLEHVRPRGRLLGWLADLATVVTRRVFGFRANRRTEANVAAAALEIIDIRRSGIWREIVATPAAAPNPMRERDEP